ncbi:MAG: hypothetical protein K2J20_03790, partial [Bacilli bacterium]|nr:hypothetical protein [Bacilli bacterium]
MKLFKKTLNEQPLYYWEERSYMMVIPKSEDENIIKDGTERLLSSKEFKVNDLKAEANGVITLKVLYDKEEYEVGFYLGGICVPEYYLSKNFLFSAEEQKDILNAHKALT